MKCKMNFSRQVLKIIKIKMKLPYAIESKYKTLRMSIQHAQCMIALKSIMFLAWRINHIKHFKDRIP